MIRIIYIEAISFIFEDYVNFVINILFFWCILHLVLRICVNIVFIFIFSVEDDLSSFYTSLSTILSNSSVEPQAETNLIEHNIAHNVLRHLIVADGKRQKKNKQSQCELTLNDSFYEFYYFFLFNCILALISTLLSTISPDKLRTWILCNRGCFILVM